MNFHHSFRSAAFALALLLMPLLPTIAVSPAFAQAQPMPKLDVPYVPTPPQIVERMLDLAAVNENDTLFDLGCGDGRIVIAAAKERGAKGTGIDLNPQRIAEAKSNAKSAGVQDKVKFMVGDLFDTDFSSATVVTLYLLPDVNRKLRPQLWKQLKVGTRVVSHDFDMGEEWPPEKVERIGNKTLYFWTVNAANKAAVNDRK